MSNLTLHYESEGIADRILSALHSVRGDDCVVDPDALAAMDHFHTRGLAATKELAKRLDPRAGETVLDIGAGIGGPARWIANHFGCRVIGVDVLPAFCSAARTLNAACGLQDRVEIVEADALSLPLPSGIADRAYSQNVVMNIADKAALYREIARALKPGGVVVFSNFGAGVAGAPVLPTPWASTPDSNHLATLEETQRDLEVAGFVVEAASDTTNEMIEALRSTRTTMEREGRPTLSTDVLMGPRMAGLQENLYRSLTSNRLTALEVSARLAPSDRSDGDLHGQ